LAAKDEGMSKLRSLRPDDKTRKSGGGRAVQGPSGRERRKRKKWVKRSNGERKQRGGRFPKRKKDDAAQEAFHPIEPIKAPNK
jgi:hypothetical protein